MVVIPIVSSIHYVLYVYLEVNVHVRGKFINVSEIYTLVDS